MTELTYPIEVLESELRKAKTNALYYQGTHRTYNDHVKQLETAIKILKENKG